MAVAASQVDIAICPDATALAAAAAERIVAAAKAAIDSQGRFTLALSGGSTPERTYKLLAQSELKSHIDWSHTWLLFGDERYVPPEDPRSNYRMADESLFKPAGISPRQILPIPTNLATPADCAVAYERSLRQFFDFTPPADSSNSIRSFPQLDLILLGLGDDGHTASLFPGKPTLQETRAWVTWSPPGVLPPPVDRVTFTFPLINAARQVMFLISGEAKASIARDVIEGPADVRKHPASGVRPLAGKLTWLLDEPAAGLLSRKPVER